MWFYKKSFVPAIVNFVLQPHMKITKLIRLRAIIAADVAIKTAYFSFVAAAFIFVSMLLLAGVHP
jgi:hypothetical protein